MVRDGVTDAAALAQADLWLHIGTGADVASQAPDSTTISQHLRGPSLACGSLFVVSNSLWLRRFAP